MTKRLWMIVLLSLLSLMFLSAGNNELRSALPGLTEHEYTLLEEGGNLFGGKSDGQNITRFFILGSEAYRQAQQAGAPSSGFALSAVTYVPYTDTLSAMGMQQRQLSIFNAVRALSTQEGLTYISRRAGYKPRVLIQKSSYMEDERNLNRLLADPVATEFPYQVQSYFFQRDTTFGGNRYLQTFLNSDKEIFVNVTNLSTMRALLLVPALKPGELQVNLSTYQLQKGLLVTALASVVGKETEVSILGISVDLVSAFERRIVALQRWFLDRIATIQE